MAAPKLPDLPERLRALEEWQREEQQRWQDVNNYYGRASSTSRVRFVAGQTPPEPKDTARGRVAHAITPLFLHLAAVLVWFADLWRQHRLVRIAASLTAVLMLAWLISRPETFDLFSEIAEYGIDKNY